MTEFQKITSITQVHDLLGIGKPKHSMVSVIKGSQFNTQSDSCGYRFFMDLFQITLKDNLRGSFQYGRNTYDFEEGTMIFSKPGQTIEYDNTTDSEEDFQGWTLIFHPDLIRKTALGKEIDSYNFFFYEANEALHISEDERKSLEEIIQKIEKEYSQNMDRYSQNLIVSNIKLLLDYCTRYFDRQFYTRTGVSKDVVSNFERLLKSYYESEKPMETGVPSVQYLGRELAISPYYLGDLLKKETGRNTIEHIHFFIVDRAKTVLLNSSKTVSEIAYELGFEYPQHFAKVFKNKTGISPKQYRTLT